MRKLLFAVLVLWWGAALADPAPVPAAEIGAAAAQVAAPAPATPAPAEKKPEVKTTFVNATAEEQAQAGGFHLGVELDTAMGQGTLADPRYYAYAGSSIALGPSYGFRFHGVKLNASARASLGWEYTLPDNPTGRRVDWSDLRLGISAPAVWKESRWTGISVSPSLGASVPLSLHSQFTSSITTVSLGFSFMRHFSRFDLMYRLAGAHGFYGNPAKVASADRNATDPQGNPLYLCRVDEQYCGGFGLNTEWTVSNALAAVYRPTERLSVEASFGISNGFHYAMPVDQYTPQTVDSQGNPVVRPGDGRVDMMTGALGVSYALSDNLGLSLGMATAQPPLTADNQHLRFPFFSFIGQERNSTQYSLTLSAAY